MADDRGVPLFSVVLATNRAGGAPFLEAAVDSVLAQTYAAFEFVIIDDGSPNAEIIPAFAARDPRIRSVRVDHVGVARARNVAVGHAKGDFVAFIDDDDLWHPGRLAHHVTAMTEVPSAALSYCRMRTIDEAGNELAPGDQRAVRDIHDIYRRTTGILMPNMVMRRDAFIEVGGFDPLYRIAEDLDLLLRLARLGPAVFIDVVLVDYRAHGNNTTKRHREVAASVGEVLRVHRWSALQRDDAELAADLAFGLTANNRYAAWSAARAARGMLRGGHPGHAIGELAWALRFAPSAPIDWLVQRLPSRSPLSGD